MSETRKAFPRAAGILMPLSSLSSPYGIGSMGSDAYDFIDFLHDAGQCYWQILPVSQTSYGDSPYQSFSAFAGNPYFIDLDILIQEGLLDIGEVQPCDFSSYIDYGSLYKERYVILRRAFKHFCKAGELSAFEHFCSCNRYWLDDYALFMAIKDSFGGLQWQLWSEELRVRDEAALKRCSAEYAEDIAFWKFLQWKFFEQWDKLKVYAHENGVKIIGDIPIYVAMDSADLWANSKLFLMNEELKPTKVAGVPPDYFSETGQLWGNPIYDWDAMRADNYEWWRRRIGFCSRIYDVIRIDHFIGIVSYFSIDANAKTAIGGMWMQGPGMELLHAIDEACGEALVIAEDLGVVSDEVRRAQLASGYPGMKVLQFAFDSGPSNVYLPHNHSKNSVVYTGTHDNNTLVGWINSCPKPTLRFMREYFDVFRNELLPSCLIRAAMASVAHTCIIPLTDWLELDSYARTNTPSTLGDNWKYRVPKELITSALAQHIKRLTVLYGRN